MGIRQMKQFNNALLAKQTWRLLTNEDNLSMKILQSKYVKRCPDKTLLVIKQRDSSTWKGIARQMPLINCGAGKVVINGRSTLFWMEKWLDNFELQDHVLGTLDGDELQKKVVDCWEEFNWKWHAF